MHRIRHINKFKSKNPGTFKEKFFNVILALSIIVFAASVIQTSGKIKKINKEVDDRVNKLAELQKEKEKMQKKYEEVTSQEYMETQLRNQLNMSKSNEIILVLPEDELLRKLSPTDGDENEIDTMPNYLRWAEVFGII